MPVLMYFLINLVNLSNWSLVLGTFIVFVILLPKFHVKGLVHNFVSSGIDTVKKQVKYPQGSHLLSLWKQDRGLILLGKWKRCPDFIQDGKEFLEDYERKLKQS